MRLTFAGSTSHAATATAQHVVVGGHVERLRSPLDLAEGRSCTKSALLLQQRGETVELASLHGAAGSAGGSRATSRPMSPIGHMAGASGLAAYDLGSSERAHESRLTYPMGMLAEVKGADDGTLGEARTGGVVHRLALCSRREWTLTCWVKLPLVPPDKGGVYADARPLCAAVADSGCGRPLSHVLFAFGEDGEEQHVRLGACFGVDDGARAIRSPTSRGQHTARSTRHAFQLRAREPCTHVLDATKHHY